MTQVNLKINGRSYTVGCDEGQESRVQELAAYIDERASKIGRAAGVSNDAQVLVLAALVLADELFETKSRQASHAAAVQTSKKQPAESTLSRSDETALAKVIDHLTGRIEALAARLEAA